MIEFSETEKILARFFVEREGEGILSDIRGVNFREAGILDSLDMVTLAVYVQRQFGKKLDLSDPRTLSAMAKFDSLISLIGP